MSKVARWMVVILVVMLVLSSAGCTPTEKLPAGPGAEWSVVVIGDSSMWLLADALASQIEKDLGVKVIVEDFALPFLSAGSVLEALQTGKSANIRLEDLSAAIQEAEMVVMFVNPSDSIVPGKPFNLDGCFMGAAPQSCEMAALEKYKEDIKAIWSTILELRSGKETILRATDIYNPIVEYWIQNGVLDACSACWENMSLANQQAAAELGIPFISRYLYYNGPDHTENPMQKGYIRDDHEHPSELGAQYTASLIAEIGYDPVLPNQ